MVRDKQPPVIPSIDPVLAFGVKDRWLTIAEAAAYLKISQNYLRKIVHDGEIKAARIGRIFHFDREHLDQWMSQRIGVVRPYCRGTRPWVAQRHAENRKAAR